MIVNHSNRPYAFQPILEQSHLRLVDVYDVRFDALQAVQERDGDTLFEERLVLRHLPPRDFLEGEETLMTSRAQPLGGVSYVLLDAAEVSTFLIYVENSHEWTPRRYRQDAA